jgi:hypothetical protein
MMRPVLVVNTTSLHTCQGVDCLQIIGIIHLIDWQMMDILIFSLMMLFWLQIGLQNILITRGEI